MELARYRVLNQLHGLGLELRAEPPTLLGREQILSIETPCPKTLVRPIYPERGIAYAGGVGTRLAYDARSVAIDDGGRLRPSS